ncbi:uncharacterized protein LOC114522442 [Dendronephthya gigantea]|uniref:uncharacterized protein LOC114522442 n=1 Tax=Dendronephthya gigantea TaxID=151771 RepID=UPI001069B4D7|nr:uncharacterized protein LOC114522442 [Dendronephthya gigantea]
MAFNVPRLSISSCNTTIFWIIFLLLGILTKLVQLTAIKSADSSCSIIAAKPIKEKKPLIDAIEKSCVAKNGECYSRCIGNPTCRSFGIARGVDECPNSLQCFLYSETVADKNSYGNDRDFDYYISGPLTCCTKPCINAQVCHEKTCQCECPEGYASYNCMCLEEELNQVFNRKTPMMLPDVMKQVDSGEQTWGVKDDLSLWTLVDDQWTLVDQNAQMKYISSGKAGTWGINSSDSVLVREVTVFGTSWKHIPFPKNENQLIQIDSGSSGVVYAVNGANEIYCRANITTQSPFGSSWIKVPGAAKHVSCGDYGCFAVRSDGTVAFRKGVSVENCKGTNWTDIPGDFIQLDAGKTGSIYGIGRNQNLYRIAAICEKMPLGHKRWIKVLNERFTHVAVGDQNMFAVAENGTVFKFSP